MSKRRSRDELLKRFSSRYGEEGTDAGRLVECRVIGANVGANGYTTLAQADRLVEALDLSPESRLLDLGSGRGWPGLHLAARTGCHTVLTDVPEAAVRTAQQRSADASPPPLTCPSPPVLSTQSATPTRSDASTPSSPC